MNNRNGLLFILCAAIFIAPVAVQAKKVELEKAERLAQRFVEKKHGQRAKENVRLKHAAKRQKQKAGVRMLQSEPEDIVHYYVFSINEDSNGGFVIVAGDDVVKPVLGYSDNGNYDESNLPPNFAYWMSHLQQQITWAQEHGIEQTEAVRREWERYIDGDISASAGIVEPLIQTKWNQRAPYNNMAPMDGSNRSVTGCVATAMAQIMKFHNHPVRGYGWSEAYTTGTHEINVPSVNFDVEYDWDNMLNSYTSNAMIIQEDAVATLMYHAGVSVQMDYSPTGSGAYSRDVPMALTAYFGYDRSIQHRQRENYNDAAWETMLMEQINAGMPVYYTGRNDESGHAFILDGYDGAGKFHFNWGWGGLFDGYFVTTALNPGVGGDGAGSGTYNDDQSIIINIKPDEDSVVSDFYRQIAAYKWSLEDVIVEAGQDLTLSLPVNIPENANGAALIIRSVNPAEPVILRRGVGGDLFTVSLDAALILEDIIIDGDSNGDFENSYGSLVMVRDGGTFVMNDGAVVRNNTASFDGGVQVSGGTFTMTGGEISGNTATSSSGGGVSVNNGGTFTMSGGEISGNIANYSGGGVRVSGGTFTMTGGKINGNIANYSGGGVDVGEIFIAVDGETVRVYGTFTMVGGEISGNAAGYGNGVNVGYGNTFAMNSGVIAGTGSDIFTVVSGSHNLNAGNFPAPNNGVIIAWNKSGVGPFVYTKGTNTHLSKSPTVTTVVWAIDDNDKFGISYKNGDNEGFIRISDVAITQDGNTPALLPQITASNISARAIGNTIVLQNLPQGAKVKVYNLQGKRIYNSQLSTLNSQLLPHSQLIIKVQTKGVYIIKINNQTLRIAVK
ncbi:MAG: C10 family peptidase [Fibromonadaceae bacterium]|jgi:hypothetical protein|nr:C10 family peptidase [Fibromonadaceae bacterium]